MKCLIPISLDFISSIECECKSFCFSCWQVPHSSPTVGGYSLLTQVIHGRHKKIRDYWFSMEEPEPKEGGEAPIKKQASGYWLFSSHHKTRNNSNLNKFNCFIIYFLLWPSESECNYIRLIANILLEETSIIRRIPWKIVNISIFNQVQLPWWQT